MPMPGVTNLRTELLKAVRKSGKDDCDKFSLPTRSGFF